METAAYVKTEQFERDWRHVKNEVKRLVGPLVSESAVFRATPRVNRGIAWMEIMAPFPSVRLIAITLPRELEPLTLRITAWFYADQIRDYQRWCAISRETVGGLPHISDGRKPPSSWGSFLKIQKEGIKVVGVEHGCRDLMFHDEVSMQDFLVPRVRNYVRELSAVLDGVPKTYRLLGPDGKMFESLKRGQLGGNGKALRYGRLDCSAANSVLDKGYDKHRVFFANEDDAIAAGYVPCGSCMQEQYKLWKSGGMPCTPNYPWKTTPKT